MLTLLDALLNKGKINKAKRVTCDKPPIIIGKPKEKGAILRIFEAFISAKKKRDALPKKVAKEMPKEKGQTLIELINDLIKNRKEV